MARLVDAKAWLAYVAISGFLIVAANLITDSELTSQADPDWLDKIAAFLTFQGPADLPDWMGFLIVLVVGGGAFFLLASIVVPILAGAASNSIAGTVIVGVLLAIGGVVFLVGIL